MSDIEEKRKMVQDLCDARLSCDGCPCGSASVASCYAIEIATESELDKMLVAFGGAAPAKPEAVDHPGHYQGPNECIDVMLAMFGLEAVKHFCACNAYKYRFRADRKNGAEDIKKAEWYETKLIELGGL